MRFLQGTTGRLHAGTRRVERPRAAFVLLRDAVAADAVASLESALP